MYKVYRQVIPHCDDRFFKRLRRMNNKGKTNSATRLASEKGTRHYSKVLGSATNGNRTGLKLGLQQFNLQLVNVNHTDM